jgi:hypothetical protein
MTCRHVFDLELAATMLANGVPTIYTYDPRFAKLPGIDARECRACTSQVGEAQV